MKQEVTHDSKLNMVVLCLEGTLFFEDYKKAWLTALSLIEEKQSKRFLIDTRNHKSLALESKMWFKHSFLNEARKKLKEDVRVARINSKYIANQEDVKEIYEYFKVNQYDFQFKVCNEYMEATDWLILSN